MPKSRSHFEGSVDRVRRAGIHILAWVLLLVTAVLAAGCIPVSQRGPAGSSVTRVSAAAELARLSSTPVPVKRPIVVLSGYHTLAMHAAPLASNIVKATSGRPEDVLLISYPMSSDIDDITEAVID